MTSGVDSGREDSQYVSPSGRRVRPEAVRRARSFVFSAATRTLPAAWPKESPVMWRLDFHRLWSVVDSILWKHEEDVGPKGQTWSEVFFGQGAVGVCLIGTCRTQLGTREGTLCSISNLSASWCATALRAKKRILITEGQSGLPSMPNRRPVGVNRNG